MVSPCELKTKSLYNSRVSLHEGPTKNPSEKVVLQNVSSDWIDLYQRVPQGTILGPLLFNFYVNSMLNTIITEEELLLNLTFQNTEKNVREITVSINAVHCSNLLVIFIIISIRNNLFLYTLPFK